MHDVFGSVFCSDISMLLSEGFDVLIVAFRVGSGVSLEYLAQTDGDFRALDEQHLLR